MRWRNGVAFAATHRRGARVRADFGFAAASSGRGWLVVPSTASGAPALENGRERGGVQSVWEKLEANRAQHRMSPTLSTANPRFSRYRSWVTPAAISAKQQPAPACRRARMAHPAPSKKPHAANEPLFVAGASSDLRSMCETRCYEGQMHVRVSCAGFDSPQRNMSDGTTHREQGRCSPKRASWDVR